MAASHSARISVFLKLQDPLSDFTSHSASKSLALLCLAAPLTAKPIRYHPTGPLVAIHLLTSESWKEVKQRVRPILDKRNVVIPKTTDSGMSHPWSWSPREAQAYRDL